MQAFKIKTILKYVGALFALALLSGCGVLDPKGAIGEQEKSLIIISTLLMLIVVVPVIFMSIYFPYKYRSSNKDADYEPEWSHSSKIEIVVWAVPVIIILILGTITWKTTHSLEQTKSIAHENEEIIIDVVALDWQWLFIYPEQNIASINEVTFPKNTPVKFRLTAHETMNSFFIPQMGSQMYAMAAMMTQVNLIANEAGEYKGISSGYSGHGFSHMKFTAKVTETHEEYTQWLTSVKANPEAKVMSSFDDYLILAKPTENVPVSYYSSVPATLFSDVVNQHPGSMNHSGDHGGNNMEHGAHSGHSSNDDHASHDEHASHDGEKAASSDQFHAKSE